jgi:holo-ACP synthase CitX
MLKGVPVALPAMLACREARVALQDMYRDTYHTPILSFCLNIPGPIKTTPELRRVFEDGLAAIRQSIAEEAFSVAASTERHEPTGDEALLAIAGNAAKIKEQMTQLEETHPLGRLFDIDVLTASGKKLSRGVPRRCLLCDEQAQACARSRRHSVKELTAHIETMVQEFLQKKSI